MALPTNRTTSTSIADHVADHNVLHEQHNDLEGHAEATTEVHGIADTSQLATNADVAAAVAGLVDSAPATLDTLNELAAALGDDESFATTVTTALAGKAATGHDHDVDYEAAGAVATHAADTTDVHGIADTSALALTSHTHSGTYVPVPADPPTPGQILSATDDDPLTTDWIDAPSGGGGIPGEYGDGSDGVVDFDGSTTVLGLTPSSGVYTLARDVYLADGSQISGTAVIKANGFRLLCRGTFTIGASAKIHNDGNAASGATAGAATNTSGTIKEGTAGGAGGSANGTAGSANNTAALGGAGGAGGGSGGSPGGGGGAVTAPTAAQSGYRSLPFAAQAAGGFSLTIRGGAGGGGGGGSFGNGGGGGGGGGVLLLACYSIVNNGTISANGGAGANGTAGNAHGGGGGGGGTVFLIYGTFTGNAATASGGTKGLKSGTGNDGVNGSPGTVITLVSA